jgi:hypothetical protein
MNLLELSIVKTVAYFDVFKYPVSKNEIGYFLDQKYAERALDKALNNLIRNDILFQLDDFYSLSNDISLVNRRIEGNNAAIEELKKAKRIARFLYQWFPYIKGIAISGSLSKNFAYKDSDFDFFVITSTNRLWVTRFIFIMFYRVILLFGFKNMFCLNYMLDENAFEIDEKNIFTAIEIATLVPCSGTEDYNKFFKNNNWVEDFLPNYFIKSVEDKEVRPFFVKRILERLLNNSFGDKMNVWILNFYKKRWEKLFAKNKYSKTGFRLGGVIADTHIFKPLPQLFQKKVIASFNEKFLNAKKIMAEKCILIQVNQY